MTLLNVFQNLKELNSQHLSLNVFSNILIKIEMEELIWENGVVEFMKILQIH